MASLIWAFFPLWRRFSSILRIEPRCWRFILSLSFSILLSYLHLLNVSPRFPCKFLKSWISAFSLIWLSAELRNAVSATDLIAKLMLEKICETNLHDFINFYLYVIFNHLLYILLFLFIVLFINCIADLFFKFCPYYNYSLNGINVFLKVLSINPLNPF
jgi:hypothetical protein